ADLGRLDILITSAGTAAFAALADSKPADWDAMLSVNLRAAMVCCHAVLPPMMRQGSGTIVNVASIAAKRALPGSAVYTATKAGLFGFSRVLAEELRSTGVRVGVLMPGAVDTPLWDTLGGSPPRDKMLRPEDVARAAVLMASLPPHAVLEELTLLPSGGILRYDGVEFSNGKAPCFTGGSNGHYERDGRQESFRAPARGRQARVGPAHPQRR